jgi:magnesium transporter
VLHTNILANLAARDTDALKALLVESDEVEILAALHELTPNEQGIAFRLLPKDQAMSVFEELDTDQQENLLRSFTEERTVEFIDEMPPDARVRLLDEMPAAVAKRLISALSPEERRTTNTLMGYEPETAGRIMTPEYVSLRPYMSVPEALAKVRRQAADKETIYTLYVTTPHKRLLGVVSLKELLIADDDATVESIMNAAVSVTTGTDQERVARQLQDLDLLALPVVDNETRIVGIVTVDDAGAILEEEETEDAARQGGSSPWAGHYMSVSVFEMFKTRFIWLVILLVVSLLTVMVSHHFEDAIADVAALAIFIPLLIGTGGKVGTQASSACVRALALDEVRPADAAKVFFRETRTGLLLGIGLGVLSIAAGWIFAPLQVAVVVGISLLLICLLGALVGGLSPLAAKALNIDPAMVSAPVVTTLVDVLGLVIYFLVASAVLGL